ncbi:helix-turn-helix transcriptional regulator [Runella limosa]|uniref:helix-turn-helix transcriptional regulator n=1 Tax=Runella limosa TaxID=370978 RepID=UPI0004111D3C|nr:helix-turn-helix transcriptional regulator [Runella limosa]
MNASLQPTTSSEGSALEKSVLPQTESTKIMIVLNAKDFQECCLELVRQQIAFEVKYNGYLSPKTVIDRTSAFKDNYLEIVKKIHDKYLQGDFGNVPPSEKEITENHGIKPALFKSLFKKVYGQPFYQLYTAKRMERAASLLKKGYKANEVALMIGYSASSAIKFNKMFQKYFHITPKKYQLQFYGKINRR